MGVRLHARRHDAITAVDDAWHVNDGFAVVFLVRQHHQKLEDVGHQHLRVSGEFEKKTTHSNMIVPQKKIQLIHNKDFSKFSVETNHVQQAKFPISYPKF